MLNRSWQSLLKKPSQPQPQPHPYPCCKADFIKAYLPTRRDDEAGRDGVYTPCVGDAAIWIIHHWEVYAFLLHVLDHFFRLTAIHGDGDDVCIVVRDGVNRILLRFANRTPCRPEMYQHGAISVDG